MRITLEIDKTCDTAPVPVIFYAPAFGFPLGLTIDELKKYLSHEDQQKSFGEERLKKILRNLKNFEDQSGPDEGRIVPFQNKLNELLNQPEAAVYAVLARYGMQRDMVPYLNKITIKTYYGFHDDKTDTVMAGAFLQFNFSGHFAKKPTYAHFLIDPKMNLLLNRAMMRYSLESICEQTTSLLKTAIEINVDEQCRTTFPDHVIFSEPSLLNDFGFLGISMAALAGYLSNQLALLDSPKHSLSYWRKTQLESLQKSLGQFKSIPIEERIKSIAEKLTHASSYSILTQYGIQPEKISSLNQITVKNCYGFHDRKADAILTGVTLELRYKKLSADSTSFSAKIVSIDCILNTEGTFVINPGMRGLSFTNICEATKMAFEHGKRSQEIDKTSPRISR